MSSQLMRAEDLNFIDDNVKEIYRRVIMTLSNVKRFYELFAQKIVVNDSSEKIVADDSSENTLDKWILSKNHKLIKNSTKNFDEYNTNVVCAEILEFVEDLSTWYVRRSRDRFKEKDSDAIKTVSFVLENLSKIIAPIMPFISEEIFQTLKGTNFEKNNSVHLEKWPVFDETKIDLSLEENMEKIRVVVSNALDKRIKEKIPVKQPLARVIISGVKIPEELFWLIEEELNIKKVELKEGKELEIELDTILTPELKAEGAVRELMRSIQSSRKESGLSPGEIVTLDINSPDKEFLEKFRKMIEEKTSTKMNFVETEEYKKYGEKEVFFEIKK
jgi:isoleucyl-tRNA synthetase